MPRTRNIKPEFFRHEKLQELEKNNPGNYVMLVFAALWGHCDINGVFKYSPKVLRLDILPFLNFSMEKTLSLLSESGFIIKYSIDGIDYGFIQTFISHQRITGKEAVSCKQYPINKEIYEILNNDIENYNSKKTKIKKQLKTKYFENLNENEQKENTSISVSCKNELNDEKIVIPVNSLYNNPNNQGLLAVRMMKVWKKYKPEYFIIETVDFDSILDIAKHYKKMFGWTHLPTHGDNLEKTIKEWSIAVSYIVSDKFLKDKDLGYFSIEKNFSSLINRIIQKNKNQIPIKSNEEIERERIALIQKNKILLGD